MKKGRILLIVITILSIVAIVFMGLAISVYVEANKYIKYPKATCSNITNFKNEGNYCSADAVATSGDKQTDVLLEYPLIDSFLAPKTSCIDWINSLKENDETDCYVEGDKGYTSLPSLSICLLLIILGIGGILFLIVYYLGALIISKNFRLRFIDCL